MIETNSNDHRDNNNDKTDDIVHNNITFGIQKAAE